MNCGCKKRRRTDDDLLTFLYQLSVIIYQLQSNLSTVLQKSVNGMPVINDEQSVGFPCSLEFALLTGNSLIELVLKP